VEYSKAFAVKKMKVVEATRVVSGPFECALCPPAQDDGILRIEESSGGARRVV
jgi:hypothetical protein